VIIFWFAMFIPVGWAVFHMFVWKGKAFFTGQYKPFPAWWVEYAECNLPGASVLGLVNHHWEWPGGAAAGLALAMVFRWFWKNRKKIARQLGAKTRAIIAAMRKNMKRQARPVFRPQPQGA